MFTIFGDGVKEAQLLGETGHETWGAGIEYYSTRMSGISALNV